MARQKETLGPLELDVLQHVVDHHPISVREAAAHFGTLSGQARTTVLTVMERLRRKGFLNRRKVDGRHQYTPTIVKSELLRGIVADFVNDVLGGNVSPFVAYLAQSSKLNGEEIRKLEQLLKRIETREQRDKP
ncbi:MAG TPA: BlaI/MecI/CopY family transcriptional regulator [Pirellulales bacterium]|jgi:predicted transcriptional regulator